MAEADLGLLFRKRIEASRAFVTGLAHRQYLLPGETPLALLAAYALALFGTKLAITPLEVAESVAHIIGSQGVARLGQGTVLQDIFSRLDGHRSLFAGLKTDMQLLLPTIAVENMIYSSIVPFFAEHEDEDDDSPERRAERTAYVLQRVKSESFLGHQTAPHMKHSRSVDGLTALVQLASSGEHRRHPPLPHITESADERDRDVPQVEGEASPDMAAQSLSVPTHSVADDVKDAPPPARDNNSDELEYFPSDDGADWWPSGSGSVRRVIHDDERQPHQIPGSGMNRVNSVSRFIHPPDADDRPQPDVVSVASLDSADSPRSQSPHPGDHPHPTPETGSSWTTTLTSFLRRRMKTGPNNETQPDSDNPDTHLGVQPEQKRQSPSPGRTVTYDDADPAAVSEQTLDAFFNSDVDPLATDQEDPPAVASAPVALEPPRKVERSASVDFAKLNQVRGEDKHVRYIPGSQDWKAAALTKIASTAFTHPLRMLRQRRIAVACGVGNVPASSTTLSDCIRDTIYTGSGPFGLHCGFWPSILHSFFYVILKEVVLRKIKAMNEKVNPGELDRVAEDETVLRKLILFEYIAGIITDHVLYPILVVIRRLQVAHKLTANKGRGRGRATPTVVPHTFFGLARNIFLREGWRGFYTGFSYHLSYTVFIYFSTWTLFYGWREIFRRLAGWYNPKPIEHQPEPFPKATLRRKPSVSFSGIENAKKAHRRSDSKSRDRSNS